MSVLSLTFDNKMSTYVYMYLYSFLCVYLRCLKYDVFGETYKTYNKAKTELRYKIGISRYKNYYFNELASL